MQQLPDIEKTDSKKEKSCLKWTINNGRRKVCVNFQTDKDKLNIVVYRYWNNLYLKDNEVDLELTEYHSLLAKRVYLLGYIDIFYNWHVPKFCHFVDHPWLFLENSPFKNLWRINCLGWKFVQCGRIRFALAKIMNKLISTRNRVFISLVGPSETGNPQPNYNWLKIGTFQPKFDKIYLFLSAFANSSRCYAIGNWKSRVYAWRKLWIYWFDKKQLYKVLVNFWRLLWRDLQFKGLCWPCYSWETSGSEHNLP